MKQTMRRLLCVLLTLCLLAGGVCAAGQGEGLVSLSWLTGTFVPQAVEKGGEAAGALLQKTYDSALEQLDGAQTGQSGLQSDSLSGRAWSDGAVLELPTGSVFLLLEGAASVLHSGAVVDVTAGAETAAGARLIPNHRYLVAEDTTASVTILSGAAQLGVQGSYRYTPGRANPTPFYDVCQTDWYYTPVTYVYQSGLFSGMEDHRFAPGEAMNRAMLMTVLYRLAGSPAGELQEAGGVRFVDVAESAWYAPYVKWGAAQSITSGTGADTFSPEQPITREQLVVLLYSFATHYLNKPQEGRADLADFRDLNQASDWAREALSWAVFQGIVSSASAGELTLNPRGSASRAEVSAMLRAFSEKIH